MTSENKGARGSFFGDLFSNRRKNATTLTRSPMNPTNGTNYNLQQLNAKGSYKDTLPSNRYEFLKSENRKSVVSLKPKKGRSSNFFLKPFRWLFNRKENPMGNRSYLSGGSRRFSAFRHRARPNIALGDESVSELSDQTDYAVCQTQQKVMPPSRRPSLMLWITDQLRQPTPKRSTVTSVDVATVSPQKLQVPTRTRRLSRRRLSGFRRRSRSATIEDEVNIRQEPKQQEQTKTEATRRSSFKRILSVVWRQKDPECECRSQMAANAKASEDQCEKRDCKKISLPMACCEHRGTRGKVTLVRGNLTEQAHMEEKTSKRKLSKKFSVEESVYEQVEPKEGLSSVAEVSVTVVDVHQ